MKAFLFLAAVLFALPTLAADTRPGKAERQIMVMAKKNHIPMTLIEARYYAIVQAGFVPPDALVVSVHQIQAARVAKLKADQDAMIEYQKQVANYRRQQDEGRRRAAEAGDRQIMNNALQDIANQLRH